MKKRLLVILLAGLMLVGCGDVVDETKEALSEAAEEENAEADTEDESKVVAESDSVKAEATTEDESAEAQVQNVDLSKVIGNTYTYEEYVSGENVYDHQSVHEITLNDETNATYKITDIYSDNKKTTTEFDGTFTYSERQIVFAYKDSDEAPVLYYVFKLEDEKVTGIETAEYDYSTVAGTYTGTVKEFGKVSLEVTDEGKATLTASDQTFTGDLVYTNDRWNYIGYDSKTGDVLDWYVYFSGKTFTHEGYEYTIYKTFEGNFGVTGEYGYIEFQLYGDGTASKYFTQDGNTVFYSGTYTVDLDTQHVTNIYLSSADGRVMNFEIQYNDDGTKTYTGGLE